MEQITTIEKAKQVVDHLVKKKTPKINKPKVWFKWLWAEDRKKDHTSGYGQILVYREWLEGLPGYAGETRKWRYWGGSPAFGNYTADEWVKFLLDIQKNGIRYPVTVTVEPDGKMYIFEGNHRIAAAKQLGLDMIPIDLSFRGRGEDRVRDSKWKSIIDALKRKFNYEEQYRHRK